MKILNLYAGIGGNRKLWQDVEVTAVEINPKVAQIYQLQFPEDIMIVGDAHEYLLKHHKEYDFIWSSPPCPTHSRIRKFTNGGRFPEVYPDVNLWQEVIFLQHHATAKWVVENVISYYEPFIKPQKAGRHYFWSNFSIIDKPMPTEIPNTKFRDQKIDKAKYWDNVPRQFIRNAVHPELGKHIFRCAFADSQLTLKGRQFDGDDLNEKMQSGG